MLANFDELIIPNYNAISGGGGGKLRRSYKSRRIIKNKTRKFKKSNKSRTRRTYR